MTDERTEEIFTRIGAKVDISDTVDGDGGETVWLEDASITIENGLDRSSASCPVTSEVMNPTFSFDILLDQTWTATDQETGTEREVPAHEVIQSLFGIPFLGIDWDDQCGSSKEPDHPVGSVAGFVADLTRITRKHGVFIRPAYNDGDIPEVGLYRQNAPHERPSDYPDIEQIPGHLSYSTVGEFYGHIDWKRNHDRDGDGESDDRERPDIETMTTFKGDFDED